MPHVIGLALCAVGNLATPDMSRDLAMEVDKHLRPGSSSIIRKKAALCTVRITTLVLLYYGISFCIGNSIELSGWVRKVSLNPLRTRFDFYTKFNI